ncbi:hypothetical protein UNDKW_1890 [Undibacterium sp. KW1]|uniref:hypothetical protein n=1 Tax=Undibacterium sp. KW1 TaxID=2058624 RepID=UPI001331E660|nr:hypothetical protein [Undibacterium sp. KW1]BBB60163.1 hypothetical protein UNDKW_1890 [Undibacterium sp. KW1]
MIEIIPIRTVDEALALVAAFDGFPKDFTLAVHQSLLDPIGINMALITDRILARGWLPDGFEQRADHRLYRYREFA